MKEKKEIHKVFEKKVKGLKLVTAEPCYLFGIIGSFILPMKNMEIR